jgi:hypothetical protein
VILAGAYMACLIKQQSVSGEAAKERPDDSAL